MTDIKKLIIGGTIAFIVILICGCSCDPEINDSNNTKVPQPIFPETGEVIKNMSVKIGEKDVGDDKYIKYKAKCQVTEPFYQFYIINLTEEALKSKDLEAHLEVWNVTIDEVVWDEDKIDSVVDWPSVWKKLNIENIEFKQMWDMNRVRALVDWTDKKEDCTFWEKVKKTDKVKVEKDGK